MPSRLVIAGIVLAGVLTGCATQPPMRAPVPGDSPPAAANEITVAATGDFISQPPLAAAARADAGGTGYDFSRILGALKRHITAADLGICHMEVSLAGPADPISDYPVFNAPPQLADAAAALGYDACSTASNHAIDYGEEGIARTLTGLDRVGIRHAGTARTEQEAMTPTVFTVRGVKIGHLSYTFSFNGIERPPGRAWIANLIDPAAILAEARRARAAGAEIVIVSLQWGTEYQHEPDIGQLGIARQLLASPDIDLIIGHHVHVVQPFERIGEKWVAYGISNMMTRFPDGSPEDTQDALVSTFTFTRTPAGWRVTKVHVVPTWMEYTPRPMVVDLTQALADPAVVGERRAAYQRAYERIALWVRARGASAAGLTVSHD